MSTDLAIVIKATALVGGALSAVGSLGGAINGLKKTTADLKREQAALHREMSQQDIPLRTLDRLNKRYVALGASIKDVRHQQAIMRLVSQKRSSLRAERDQLKSDFMGHAAIASTIVAPVKLAIDFESAMADVKKVVNFDTPQQFKEMERDVLKLTRTIPMAGEEIAAIVAAGGQSGIARENLIGFATDAAKMGVAFDMAAGQAGESMATLSNVLGIPIPKISRLGDAINHLSDNANSKASDIVNVLTRVGSDTRQLGLTENQAAALGSTFLSMGKAPELAAQAMKGMTTAFSLAKVGKMDDQLKQLGLTTKTFAAAMDKDAQSAISDFMARVKQLPKNDQYPLLLEIFGKNYADDVLLLAGNVGEYNRQLDLLSQKDASGNLKYLGSMQREFENRSATTANNIRLLKSNLVELAIEIGSVLLPAVNSLIADGKGVVTWVTDFARANPALVKGIVGAAAAFVSFKVGAFGARFALNVISSTLLEARVGLELLRSGLLRANVAMAAGRLHLMGLPSLIGRIGLVAGVSLSPALVIIGALAVAGFVVYKNWARIKGFFGGLWDGFKQGLAPIMPLLSQFGSLFGKLWAVMSPVVRPILSFFSDFFNMSQYAEGGARSFGESVGRFIGGAIAAVVSFAIGKVNEIKSAFAGGLTGIIGLIINWSPIGAFYSAFAAALNWFGFELPAKFTGFGAMLLDGLINGIRSRVEAVVATVGGVASRIKSAFTTPTVIRSPSRLFMRYGGYIMDGLDIGLQQRAARPVAAIGNMAGRLKQRFGERLRGLRADIGERLDGSAAAFSQARQGVAGGHTIHFNPTIHAPGGNPEQIQTALQMGLREFEALFRRMQAEQQRRAY